MKHICTDGKEYEVASGKAHDRCGTVLIAGKSGKPHVCGQDESECSKCGANA